MPLARRLYPCSKSNQINHALQSSTEHSTVPVGALLLEMSMLVASALVTSQGSHANEVTCCCALLAGWYEESHRHSKLQQ